MPLQYVKRERIKMEFTAGCRGYLIVLDLSQKMPKEEVIDKFLGNKDPMHWQNMSSQCFNMQRNLLLKKYPAVFVSVEMKILAHLREHWLSPEEKLSLMMTTQLSTVTGL